MKADLRAELVRRSASDQNARNARDFPAMSQADDENLPWLRQVIAEHGWPARSDVGDDGAQAAWLLVQHADDDPVFQRHCLGLLTEAVGRGEASRSSLAYLTDRVLVAERQPQEYGTQILDRNGECAPFPLRDPDGVDERRAAMSLGPLAEYLAIVAENHRSGSSMALVELTCPRCQYDIEVHELDEDGGAQVTCPGCGMGFRIAPAGSGDDYGDGADYGDRLR